MATKLKKLKLSELSLVDMPANKQARVTIFKRDTEATEQVADEVETLNKDAGDASMADQDNDLEVLKGQLADLTTKLADAEAIAKMSDAEKEYMADMDDKERAAFMAMAAEERKDKLKVAKAADEVLTVNGTEIRKSVIGVDAFAIMKSQQAELETQRQEITKAKEEAEFSVLTKRAEDEFKHVVGTAAEKASVLKALATQPEEVQKNFEAILKSAEEMAKSGFQTFGHRSAKAQAGTAAEELDTLTKSHMEKNNVTYAAAYAAVIEKRADLYERALSEGN